MTELISPQYEDFADRVGQIFTVTGLASGEPCDFMLSECSLLSSHAGQSSFSVLFRSAAGFPASQGIFTFTAPDFGPVEIFAVPVRQSEHGVEYEVIYNQMEG